MKINNNNSDSNSGLYLNESNSKMNTKKNENAFDLRARTRSYTKEDTKEGYGILTFVPILLSVFLCGGGKGGNGNKPNGPQRPQRPGKPD